MTLDSFDDKALAAASMLSTCGGFAFLSGHRTLKIIIIYPKYTKSAYQECWVERVWAQTTRLSLCHKLPEERRSSSAIYLM